MPEKTNFTRRRASLFALLLISTVLAACLAEPDSAPSKRLLAVDPAHQTCQTERDCVLVTIDCSGCECGTPVHQAFEAQYRTAYADLCRTYQGAVCDMFCPEMSLVCRSGICTTEPVE